MWVQFWYRVVLIGRAVRKLLLLLTGQRYRDDIVISHIEEYVPNFGPDVILMYDNAGPHIARIVTDGLNYADIQRLDWPARSPDLNLFEHGIILGDE
jgi:hypothetical protein